VREGRPVWLVGALDAHLRLYEGFETRLPVPYVRVDTGRIGRAELPAVASWIFESLRAAQNSGSPCGPGVAGGPPLNWIAPAGDETARGQRPAVR